MPPERDRQAHASTIAQLETILYNQLRTYRMLTALECEVAAGLITDPRLDYVGGRAVPADPDTRHSHAALLEVACNVTSSAESPAPSATSSSSKTRPPNMATSWSTSAFRTVGLLGARDGRALGVP